MKGTYVHPQVLRQSGSCGERLFCSQLVYVLGVFIHQLSYLPEDLPPHRPLRVPVVESRCMTPLQQVHHEVRNYARG